MCCRGPLAPSPIRGGTEEAILPPAPPIWDYPTSAVVYPEPSRCAQDMWQVGALVFLRRWGPTHNGGIATHRGVDPQPMPTAGKLGRSTFPAAPAKKNVPPTPIAYAEIFLDFEPALDPFRLFANGPAWNMKYSITACSSPFLK